MRRVSRPIAAFVSAMGALSLLAGPALACGGLIGPNGAVNLLRTTTLAAYHDGVEHYVTAFQFAGGGGQFGSLVPLPGIPTSVERGGDWTLQRLVRETDPVIARFDALEAAPAATGAEELLKVRIDALDITVLRGGSGQVGQWATDHGFKLPPDSPEVLDFYATRSPIFLAAVFDADAARDRGQAIGDGTPVHITIPTDNPWVPLRILSLGKAPTDRIDAAVYLLTDQSPRMLPAPADSNNGLFLDHFAPATSSLLDDLRADAGMGWIPDIAWLTKVRIDASAADLRFDLAIDATGSGQPSMVRAGLAAAEAPPVSGPDMALLVTAITGLLALTIAALLVRRRGFAPVRAA
jgi:Uncharacterized protein conserved in bacteria (DUF2330)